MKALRIFWFWILVCIPLFQQAQSPYSLDLVKDGAILGSGMLVTGLAFAKYSTLDQPTIAEVNGLDPANVPSFDRGAIWNFSKGANLASDFTMVASGLAGASLIIDPAPRKDIPIIAMMAVEGGLWVSGSSFAIKTFTGRIRPYAYNIYLSPSERTRLDARYSFVSQHTSTTSFLSFFTAKVICDYHPDSKWKPAVYSGAAILSGVTGYLRVKAGKHFPTDVIAGAGLGALIGWGIPHLHKKRENKRSGLSIYPVSNGNSMGISMVF